MRATRVIALVVVMTLALVGYRYWRSSNNASEVVAVPGLVSQLDAIPKAPDFDLAEEEAASKIVDEPGCLTLRSYEELPAYIQDSTRLRSVSVNGAALDAYQNLDESTLLGYAEQGDSVAMAIVGATNVMRAYGLSDSSAIEWLNRGARLDEPALLNAQPSSTAGLALNDASYWFYQSALHGRLFALQAYGRIKDRLFGGPVGLGWFTREEFDALSDADKISLVPEFLYAQVAYDIAPALREGALGEAAWEAELQSDAQRVIRQKLVAEFEAALIDSALPTIQVAPTALPEVEVLNDKLCESVRLEEAKRRSAQ